MVVWPHQHPAVLQPLMRLLLSLYRCTIWQMLWSCSASLVLASVAVSRLVSLAVNWASHTPLCDYPWVPSYYHLEPVWFKHMFLRRKRLGVALNASLLSLEQVSVCLFDNNANLVNQTILGFSLVKHKGFVIYVSWYQSVTANCTMTVLLPFTCILTAASRSE